VSFIALLLWGHKWRAFKYSKAVSNQIGLRSDPRLCLWIMGNDWKSVIPSASSRDVFLRKVHGVTLCHKVRSCETRNALNVKSLLRIERPE